MHMQEDKIAKKNSMAGRWSIDGPCMDNLQTHQTIIGRDRAGSPQRRNFPAFTALRANKTLMKMPEPGIACS